MTANNYFVENDYNLTLRLQELFQQYVALNSTLINSRSEDAEMHQKSIELTMQIRESINEITLLVMKMKRFHADTEIVKKLSQQTINQV